MSSLITFFPFKEKNKIIWCITKFTHVQPNRLDNKEISLRASHLLLLRLKKKTYKVVKGVALRLREVILLNELREVTLKKKGNFH